MFCICRQIEALLTLAQLSEERSVWVGLCRRRAKITVFFCVNAGINVIVKIELLCEGNSRRPDGLDAVRCIDGKENVRSFSGAALRRPYER